LLLFLTHRSLAARTNLQVEVANDRCDPLSADLEKYGARINNEACPGGLSGCKFWDTCPKEDDGACPSGCIPYSSALNLTSLQRAGARLGHLFTGSCEKACRYTDEAMLKPEQGAAFVVTSAAVLEQKLIKQEEECGNALSFMSVSCGARQRKIGSVFGFLVRALFKASAKARAGGVSECQALLPPAVGAQISTSFLKVVNYLISTGGLNATESKALRALGRLPSLPGFCQKMRQQQSALEAAGKEQNASANMKTALRRVAGSRLSQEAVDRVVEEVTEEGGTEKIVDDALAEDERGLDEAMNHTDGPSLVEVHETSRVAVASRGIISGVWVGFWSLFMHGVIGTLMGSVMTALCLVSGGMITDALGVTSEGITSDYRIFWIFTCPLQIFGSTWGLRGSMEDPFADLGFAWETVADEFRY
jgi:hypothetical protein